MIDRSSVGIITHDTEEFHVNSATIFQKNDDYYNPTKLLGRCLFEKCFTDMCLVVTVGRKCREEGRPVQSDNGITGTYFHIFF